MSTIMPKVILFDLDDTIISFSASSMDCWREVCARYADEAGGFRPYALLEAILRNSQAYWSDPVRHKRGRLDLKQARREVVAWAFESLGIQNVPLANKVADEFTTLRETSISPFPRAIETLEYLMKQGIRLGLVTNGNSDDQRRKIIQFGLEPYFELIQIEGEAGIGKPEPGVYEMALQKLRISAQEAWMVGDNLEWDVEAAQRVGLKTIWVDIAGKGLPEGGTIQPDRIIRAISELISM
jgi:putative hydrolase of the HAD superfamily